MILYDKSAHFRLMDFGIEIPVLDSRIYKTLEALGADDPDNPPAWLETSISETISRADLERVHSPEYVARFYGSDSDLEPLIMAAYELIDPDGSYRRYDPGRAIRPLTEIRELTLLNCAGTWQTCLRALETGFSYFLGGGNHHAHYDRGWGFCMINEIVIAARRLLAEQKVQRIWIIDIDAHKGDGTAALCRGSKEILTLSAHMAQGWPLDDETRTLMPPDDPCFGPSAVDVPIESGQEDRYVEDLAAGLERLEKLSPGPADLAIVVDGSDPYEHDELPSTASLRLTLDQMYARDRLVLDFLNRRSLPSAWLMAGGYGKRSWEVYARFLKSVLPYKNSDS